MRIYLELGLDDAMRQEAAKHYDEHAGLYEVGMTCWPLSGTLYDEPERGGYSQKMTSPGYGVNLAYHASVPHATDRCSSPSSAKRLSKRAVTFVFSPN